MLLGLGLLLGTSPAWSDSWVRVLLDAPPITLNPRHTGDAVGQRLNSWMYRGLTRIDPDLNPTPDLAESWKVSADGKRWNFKIRSGLQDHGGAPIGAPQVYQCLENYRIGKPEAGIRSGFPHWEKTELQGSEVILILKNPDPYLHRNVSLLRYFRTQRTEPCAEPPPSELLIGSGPYRPMNWEVAPDRALDLVPLDSERLPFRFLFVRDENTRALMLMKGDADLAQNALPLTKTRWVQKTLSDQYEVIEREGVNVAYLAFQNEHPILKDLRVRRAIALAIDRQLIVKNKMFGFGQVASSFLSPRLSEGVELAFPFDPVAAEKLLDEAGYRRKEDGTRFELKFRTTTAREGIENALMFREMLKKIGVRLELEVVEPAVFLVSIRKGRFQLFSSRWIGVADSSILYRNLKTGEVANRARFSDPQIDQDLEQMLKTTEDEKRKLLSHRIQSRMLEKVPYFPLWYWNNALVLSRRFERLSPQALSLSGSYDPLMNLKRKKP